MSVPAKFERYEIFRILLPGFYAISAIFIGLYSFFPTRSYVLSLIQLNAFLFIIIIGSIFLGLFLYAYDHPKQTRFYKELIIPNQPSNYLKKILCDECEKPCYNIMDSAEKAKPVYFYLLYSFFDPTSQGVIHYFGSVYRIYAHMRAISGLLGWSEIILALIVLLISSFFNVKNSVFILTNTIFPFILSLIFISFWMWLHPEFFNKEKLSKGDKYMLEIINFQKRYLELEKEKIKEKLCVLNKD